MKKRVKLLTTIASLCLAVALMAFGVYAATSASFKVTTSLSFDIGENIAGTVVVSEYNVAKGVTTKGSTSNSDTDNFTITANQDVTYDEGANQKTVTLEAVALTASNPTVIYEVVYSPADGAIDATIAIDLVTELDTNWKVTTPTAETNSATIVIEYVGVAEVTTQTIELKVTMAQ